MSSPKNVSSRRNFLKSAGLVTALSTLGRTAASAAAPVSTPKLAKNVIFLVADGMGNGTLGLAHHWSLQNRQSLLNWMELYNRPGLTRAYQDTASANSPVTDSAAAASSWGCGHRVNNGSVNVTPDGAMPLPILSRAKQAGKATGLVTTCNATHATPAGFAANVRSRGREDQIADQYLEREIDVMLGGGRKIFQRPADVKKGQAAADLVPDFTQKGYQFVDTKSDLLAAAGSPKLLGLFSHSHIPYAIDRSNDPALSETPGLTDMFRAALASLSKADKGFVLQVEAGRVDHAAHGNDPAAILHELLEYDACIPIALEFIEQNPDTLLILTTDHGTGGCQLNGWGSGYYSESGPALDRINRFTASFEALELHFKQEGKFDAATFESATGITANPKQIKEIQDHLSEDSNYLSSKMTRLFASQLINQTAVGWSSNNHTSECVELLAFGPGSERIPGYIQNFELNVIMREAMGIA